MQGQGMERIDNNSLEVFSWPQASLGLKHLFSPSQTVGDSDQLFLGFA